MDLQLSLLGGQRQLILEKHDFYLEQFNARVLSQLRDIGGEADRLTNAEYERLGALPGDGSKSLDEIAEEAMERGQTLYGLLGDLRKQLFLGALAALYHQWDKELREFIEREIRCDIGSTEAAKVWGLNSGRVIDLLVKIGWDCRSCPFIPRIEACGLIVNVYKHGRGRSLDELSRRFPEYLDDGFPEPPVRRCFVDHEWLSISEEQLEEIALALRSFWEAFPARLYLKESPPDLASLLQEP